MKKWDAKVPLLKRALKEINKSQGTMINAVPGWGLFKRNGTIVEIHWEKVSREKILDINLIYGIILLKVFKKEVARLKSNLRES